GWGRMDRAGDAVAQAGCHLIPLRTCDRCPDDPARCRRGQLVPPAQHHRPLGRPWERGWRNLWDAANDAAGGRSTRPEHPGDGLWDGDPRRTSSPAGGRSPSDARGDHLHPRADERLRPRGGLRSALAGQWPPRAAVTVTVSPRAYHTDGAERVACYGNRAAPQCRGAALAVPRL